MNVLLFIQYSIMRYLGLTRWQSTPVFLPEESQGLEPGGLPSMGSHRVIYD